jgi:hypothetical protein
LSYPAGRVRRRQSSRRQHPFRRIAMVVALIVVVAFGARIAFRHHSSRSSLSNIDSSSGWTFTTASQNPVTRTQEAVPSEVFRKSQPVVYPYSVVPGGVSTPQELREASDHDRIVATHYAGFDFHRARVIQVKQARLVYLSYRIGDQVFWTKKRMSLRVGENLITDGKTTARTRCGNQVSEIPHLITSPAEPAVEVLDQQIAAPAMPAVPFESALLQPPGFGTVALPPTGGGLPPGLTAFPPIGGGGCAPTPGSPCHPITPPTITPPPVNMPDPDEPSLLGSLALFWLGVAGVYFHRWKMRAKPRNFVLRLR